MQMFIVLSRFGFVAIPSTTAYAGGRIGRQIIADIAIQYVSLAIKERVQEVPVKTSLENAATCVKRMVKEYKGK